MREGEGQGDRSTTTAVTKRSQRPLLGPHARRRRGTPQDPWTGTLQQLQWQLLGRNPRGVGSRVALPGAALGTNPPSRGSESRVSAWGPVTTARGCPARMLGHASIARAAGSAPPEECVSACCQAVPSGAKLHQPGAQDFPDMT